MREAQREVRVAKRDANTRSEMECKQLRDWISVTRGELFDLLGSAFRRSDAVQSHLFPVPLRDELALVLEPNPKVLSNLACSIVQPQAARKNLASLIGTDWDTKHMPVMHNDCAPVQLKSTSRPKKPLCSVAGVCICSEKGHLTYLMRNCFIKEMKKVFSRGSTGRDLLVNAFVVAKLQGVRNAVVYDAWDDALNELQDNDPLARTAVDVTVF
jgi:hypothetical protein